MERPTEGWECLYYPDRQHFRVWHHDMPDGLSLDVSAELVRQRGRKAGFDTWPKTWLFTFDARDIAIDEAWRRLLALLQAGGVRPLKPG